MIVQAIVSIAFKPGVLDPEATAIARSLAGLGFDNVRKFERIKRFEIELEAADADAAMAQLTGMCDQLLANPVIETYRIEIGS